MERPIAFLSDLPASPFWGLDWIAVDFNNNKTLWAAGSKL